MLDGLMKRKRKFDAIIVKTTGLADPAPVAQTFFVEQDVGDATKLDAVITVTDDEALNTARALARQEGIFCGISCGGTFAAALKVAERAQKGSVILAMLPDTGERYLSTALFADLPEGSDPEP